jgi:hypothetical protein
MRAAPTGDHSSETTFCARNSRTVSRLTAPSRASTRQSATGTFRHTRFQIVPMDRLPMNFRGSRAAGDTASLEQAQLGRRSGSGQYRAFHRLFAALQVIQDSPDYRGILDACHDPYRPTAAGTLLDVDPEHPLQALRPAHSPSATGWLRPCFAADFDTLPFGSPFRRYLVAPATVRCTKSPGAILNSRRLARRAKGRKPGVNTP